MEKATETKTELTGENGQFHSFTEEFEHRFFEGAEQVKVEVTLMRDTWEAVQETMRSNDWKQNEGLIMLLMMGMAYARAEKVLSVTDGAAGLRDEEIKKLLDRAITMEAKHAAMKNFAFDIMRDHRVLEMRYDPIEKQYVAYKSLALRLKEENAALRGENERLQQALEAYKSARAQPVSRPGLWQQFLSRLRGAAE
jgi:hypothetical protein